MSNLISLAKLLKLYITLFQKHMCKHGLRKKKIRGSYTPAFKFKVVQFAEETSKLRN